MTTTAMAPPASQGAGYRALVRRKRWLLLGFFVLTTLSLLLDLALGPVGYSVRDVVQAVLWPDSVPVQLRVVVWDIRLPTALMALAVGAALSVAGAQMQTTLNNPLASPFTLGISAAASFGAALGLAFGVALFPTVAGYVVPLNAFVMAMLSAGLIHLLSMKRGVTTETIVLLGIALVFTFNALLALVQFFSWLAFFAMWSMATPGLTEHVFKAPAPDPAAFDMAVPAQAAAFQSANAAFQNAADLVGSYMGYYGLSSMLVALLLSFYAARFPLNRKAVHAGSLVLGGVGFLSMWFVPHPAWLIGSFALVGVAWASILSMPYALLSSHVPAEKMGIYMGIFNMFIVIPQIVAATLLGPALRAFFANEAVFALVISGASLLLAALALVRVREPAHAPVSLASQAH